MAKKRVSKNESTIPLVKCIVKSAKVLDVSDQECFCIVRYDTPQGRRDIQPHLSQPFYLESAKLSNKIHFELRMIHPFAIAEVGSIGISLQDLLRSKESTWQVMCNSSRKVVGEILCATSIQDQKESLLVTLAKVKIIHPRERFCSKISCIFESNGIGIEISHRNEEKCTNMKIMETVHLEGVNIPLKISVKEMRQDSDPATVVLQPYEMKDGRFFLVDSKGKPQFEITLKFQRAHSGFETSRERKAENQRFRDDKQKEDSILVKQKDTNRITKAAREHKSEEGDSGMVSEEVVTNMEMFETLEREAAKQIKISHALRLHNKLLQKELADGENRIKQLEDELLRKVNLVHYLDTELTEAKVRNADLKIAIRHLAPEADHIELLVSSSSDPTVQIPSPKKHSMGGVKQQNVPSERRISKSSPVKCSVM